MDFDEAMEENKRLQEIKRKLRLLAKSYREAPKTKSIKYSIQKAHKHMFGLTVFEDHAETPWPVIKSRSGLIIFEKILVLLAKTDIKQDKLSNYIQSFPSVSEWADVAFAEWQEPDSEGRIGQWWAQPVFYAIIQNKAQLSESAVRLSLIAFEAMEIIERRRIKHKPNPKSRANALRLTAKGFELLKELKKEVS